MPVAASATLKAQIVEALLDEEAGMYGALSAHGL